MRVTAIGSPPLFTGTAAAPLQVVRVTVDAGQAGPGAVPARATPIMVRVEGPGVLTAQPCALRAGPDRPGPFPGAGPPGRSGQPEQIAEVGVRVAAPHQPGTPVPVTAIAESPGQRAELAGEITVAETGWTMWMVSHFHYDPVWWDTQAEFTQTRVLLPGADGALPEVRTAFDLVRLHLRTARDDPDYKFVLAEIDYLKPYFDAHPEDRADLRRLLAEGRIEIVGGNYNEPNTNLTSAESTIRNAVHGVGHQRDVLGGDPASAWMLDAFGHDPSYPGLMASAGLTSSAWARGPYHQWGPQRTVGDNLRMQFPSEFEWISPDGAGLVTSYMANHYGAGWGTHTAADLPSAEAEALAQFTSLAPVAATRNVLLPVGADHVIPSRWVTAIHRDWNARYLWPRFVTALPREFFAAVAADAAKRGTWLTPQSRDMNPVYPGKDVSYIDTKQAQRAGEVAVLDGERLATLAWLAGAHYPAESLDKAWRLLAFGAHHDAITGTESDQVYLDLLGGWREAFERGDAARRAASAHLAGRARTIPPDPAAGPGRARPRAVVVFNTLSWPRSGLATITLDLSDGGPRPGGGGWPWLTLRDESGTEVPFLAEGVRRRRDGTLAAVTVTFLARVPPLGYRTYWAARASGPGEEGWRSVPGTAIGGAAFEVTADPSRGGALTSLVDRRLGRELLRGPANEPVLQEEYGSHPRWGEGQWLLSPRGPGTGSSGGPASVRAERCPIGSRLVARFPLGGLAVSQETVLWDGLDRVEFRTHVDGSIGQDALLRVRFPLDVPGGLPVYQCAVSVVGRPFGVPGADVARHPFTLDNPAHEWFGVGATLRVRADGRSHAIGVAEVILPDEGPRGTPPARRAAIRSLVAALAAQGVTATCSRPDGPRYGSLDLDSNLPDVRIALGGPDANEWTARLLGEVPPVVARALAAPRGPGRAALWLPAARPRSEAFGASADVRGPRDLPVLVVTGSDLTAALGDLVADLADAVIEADVPAGQEPGPDPPLAGHSVALLNRGTPGSLVAPDGALHIALMRASSSWPAGVWIDGDRRTTPDGASFAWQHWSHTFEYALASGAGDWRSAGFALAGQEYNHGLLAFQEALHDGRFPGRASLGEVSTPGPGPAPGEAAAGPARPAAMLTALKPHGNPLASGRPGRPSTAGRVTARLRGAGWSGGTGPATLRLFTGISSAERTDPLERSRLGALPVTEGAAVVTVPPAGLATVALRPADPATPDPATAHPDPPEPVQPVFARYWLHGKGPAPAGNLPVAVHLTPDRAALPAPGGPAPGGPTPPACLQLTVAGGPVPASGMVTLDVPDGLTATLASRGGAACTGGLRYDLPAGGYARWDLALSTSARARPGRYFLAARIRDPAAGVLEDAALVTVGAVAAPMGDLPPERAAVALLAERRATQAELDVALLPAGLSLAPGQDGEMAVVITNHTAGPVRGESQLLCPFGTWEMFGQWTRGFCARPGERVTLTYPVRAPVRARPGSHWWALAKVSYFGRVRFSQAAPLRVS